MSDAPTNASPLGTSIRPSRLILCQCGSILILGPPPPFLQNNSRRCPVMPPHLASYRVRMISRLRHNMKGPSTRPSLLSAALKLGQSDSSLPQLQSFPRGGRGGTTKSQARLLVPDIYLALVHRADKYCHYFSKLQGSP